MVKAEDIGKFPAQNIAEALQRVPGVSIVRDRGEGVFVRVRGLGPSFDIVTLNGRTAAVNENVRDGGTTGRQFRFDTFASEVVSAVGGDQEPQGVAGRRRHRRHRQHADVPAAGLQASRPDHPSGHRRLFRSWPARGSIRASRASTAWQNKPATLGVLRLGHAYDERTVRQDRIIQVGWTERPDRRQRRRRSSIPGTILIPSSARPTLEQERRNRAGPDRRAAVEARRHSSSSMSTRCGASCASTMTR